MKKYGWLTVLTAMILVSGCIGVACAEIIPPSEPGQQIGYQAVVPAGPKKENGFVYCALGDSVDSPCGWLNADYIFINPAWYVTEKQTAVYAWNGSDAPRVALLDRGTRLPILKEEGNGYLVSLRGAAGWIRK